MEYKMTIEQYNKKATEYNNRMNAIRSAMASCDTRVITFDEYDKPELYSYRADEMYKHTLVMKGLDAEIKQLSKEFESLAAQYFEFFLDSK